MKLPGSIERRPNGYRFRVRRSGVLVTIGSGLTHGEAVAMQRAYAQQLRKEWTKGGLTLTDIGEDFLERRRARGYRGLRQERNRWKTWVSEHSIGAIPLRDLARLDGVDWLDEMQALEMAPQSMKNALNLVRAALDECLERSLIDANPFRDLRVRRGFAKRKTSELDGILTPPEQQRLLAVIPEKQRARVVVSLYTGMRPTELNKVLWGDVKDDRIIARDTKNGRPRAVPLLGPALESIHPRDVGRRDGRALESPLFPGRWGRVRVTTSPKGWSRWVSAAGIKRRVVYYDLRHTCATSLLAGWWGRKWSLDEVCQMLGHSGVQVTERYARKLSETLFSAAEATNRVPGAFPVETAHGNGSEIQHDSCENGATFRTRTGDLRFTKPASSRVIVEISPQPVPAGDAHSTAALLLAGVARHLGVLPQGVAS